MPKTSAGILLFRRRGENVEVLLVHPGGPFWANRDEGAWSIPKGEAASGEDLIAAARRELADETGFLGDGATDRARAGAAEERQDRACLRARGGFRCGAIRQQQF